MSRKRKAESKQVPPLNKRQEFSSDQGAIALISVDGERFVFNPEAKKLLESFQEDLVIVSVAGKYRTGKSFFLNRVLLQAQDGTGFNVGGTVQACTKGLWMFNQLQRDENGRAILIIDTEGMGATKATDTHDTRIFALALLLSSYFVYNSLGTIDESAIATLSLVANISKHIKVSNDEEKQEANEFGSYFPDFLWLVRDFGLALVDEQGKPMTSKQYLENALSDVQGGDNESIVEKNKLRGLLRSYFPNRDCETLIRPCTDEKLLRDLNSVLNSKLRAEFLKQANGVREKVFSAPYKLVMGKPLNGPLLAQLCETYVNALNSGVAPAIRDSWLLLSETRARQALEQSMSHWHGNSPKELPCRGLDQILATLSNECITRFKDMCYAEELGIEKQLLDNLKREADRIRSDNKVAIERMCWDSLKQLDDVEFPALETEIQSKLQALEEIDEQAHLTFVVLVLEYSWKRFKREYEATCYSLSTLKEQHQEQTSRLTETLANVQYLQKQLNETQSKAEKAIKSAEKTYRGELKEALESSKVLEMELQKSEQAQQNLESDFLLKQQEQELVTEEQCKSLSSFKSKFEELTRQNQELEDELQSSKYQREREIQKLQEFRTLETELEHTKQQLAESEDELQKRLFEMAESSRRTLEEIRKARETERGQFQKQVSEIEYELDSQQRQVIKRDDELVLLNQRLDHLHGDNVTLKQELSERLAEQRVMQSAHMEDVTQLREKSSKELKELIEKQRVESKSNLESQSGLLREMKESERKAICAEMRCESLQKQLDDVESTTKQQDHVHVQKELAHAEGQLKMIEENNFELKQKLGALETTKQQLERELRQKERDFEMEKLKLQMDYELRVTKNEGSKGTTSLWRSGGNTK